MSSSNLGLGSYAQVIDASSGTKSLWKLVVLAGNVLSLPHFSLPCMPVIFSNQRPKASQAHCIYLVHAVQSNYYTSNNTQVLSALLFR